MSVLRGVRSESAHTHTHTHTQSYANILLPHSHFKGPCDILNVRGTMSELFLLLSNDWKHVVGPLSHSGHAGANISDQSLFPENSSAVGPVIKRLLPKASLIILICPPADTRTAGALTLLLHSESGVSSPKCRIIFSNLDVMERTSI